MQRILIVLIMLNLPSQSWADIQVQGYLNNAALENVAADPSCAPAVTCPEGRMIWDSVLNKFRIWDGSVWSDVLFGTATVPDPLLLGDGTVTDPTYSFSGNSGTGLYRLGFNLGIAGNGERAAQIGEGAAAFYNDNGPHLIKSEALEGAATLTLDANTGTPGLYPSRIFFGDTADDDRGRIIYDHGEDSMDFYTSTFRRLYLDTYATFLGPDGEGAATALSSDTVAIFRNDSATGNSAVLNIIAGNSTGTARLGFGDVNDPDQGRIDHTNSNGKSYLVNTNGWNTQGTNAADNAGQFYVGEVVSASPGSDPGGSCSSYTNLDSIVLTRGDWEVWGTCVLNASDSGSGALIVRTGCGISTSSTSLDDLNAGGVFFDGQAPAALHGTRWMPVNSRRFSLSASDTIYLNGFVSCTVTMPGTWDANAVIRARRIR